MKCLKNRGFTEVCIEVILVDLGYYLGIGKNIINVFVNQIGAFGKLGMIPKM